MAENINLPSGMLPLITEGSLAGAGAYDITKPHLPENGAIFKKVASGTGSFKIKRSEFNIFEPQDGGDYEMTRRISVHKVTGGEAKGNEMLGTYPNVSGLTIGLGVDLGASFKTAKQIQSLFDDAGMSEIGQKLGAAAAKRGIPAAIVTTRLRKEVQLTRQQALDLMKAMWDRKVRGTKSIVKSEAPFDINKIYEPLREVFYRIAYGNYNRLKALLKLCKGLDSYSKPLDQCLRLQECMTKSASKDRFKRQGLFVYIEKIKAVIQSGGQVQINQRGVQMSDLLDENNPIADWLGKIKGVARNNGRSLDYRASAMVTDVQQVLQDLGYYKGAIDGSFGKNSKKALIEFQKDKQLTPSGKIDKETRKYLFDNKMLSQEAIAGSKPNEEGQITEDIKDQDTTEDKANDKGDNTENKDGSIDYWALFNTILSGKGEIKASVGKGGSNKAQDVVTIKALLVRSGHLTLGDIIKEVGFPPNFSSFVQVNSSMTQAIEDFQRDVHGMSNPDALVEPNKGTLQALNGTPTKDPVAPPKDENAQASEDNENTSSDLTDETGQNTSDTNGNNENVVKIEPLDASVGKGGDNNEKDVKVIQTLLNRFGYGLEVDGDCGKLTIAAITAFQKDEMKVAKPDGRVDPDRNTWRELNAGGNGGSSDDNSNTNSGGNNNSGGNSTPPQDGDVVLAAGVVQLITEGSLAGGSYDTRVPHYPQNISYFKKVGKGNGTFEAVNLSIGVFKQETGGSYEKGQNFNPNNTASVALHKGEWVLGTWLSKGRIGSSGVTLGQGFDLGAKYKASQAAKAKKRMMDADIAEEIAEEMSKVTGIQGAAASIEASKLRAKGIKISQDSVLKLLVLTVKDYGKRYDFAGLHAALADVCKAICYARGDGGANAGGRLTAMLDDIRAKEPVEQCEGMIEWLKTFKDDQGKPRYAKQRKHVEKIKQVLMSGGNVHMSDEPISMNSLMHPNNPLADWVGDVTGSDYKQSVTVSRAQQVLIDQNYLPPTYTNSKGKKVSNADGVLGKGTAAALMRYQKDNGLKETGEVDVATLGKMFGIEVEEQGRGEITVEIDDKGDVVFQVPDKMDGMFGCFH